MSTETTCRCGKPTKDHASVCAACIHEFDVALGDIPFVDQEIETTVTRQRSAPINGGAPSTEKGLPWHDKASEARRNLRALLVSWVKLCHEEHLRGAPATLPADNLPALSAYLLHCTPGLALHNAGPDAQAEITDAVADCRRMVFWKKRNRAYLGTCGIPLEDDDGEPTGPDCDGEVYAEEGVPVGYCDDCGRGHTVVIRRDELEKRLDGMLYTAAEIARLSTFLGLDVGRDQVRRKVLYWHRHKRIEERQKNDGGDPMFRYGEVRGLLAATFTTPTDRTA